MLETDPKCEPAYRAASERPTRSSSDSPAAAAAAVRSSHTHSPRHWLPSFLAALVAALAAVLLSCTASAASAAGAETRVWASNIAVQPLVEPAQHESPGQRLRNDGPGVVTAVASGVAAHSAPMAERLFTSRFVGVDSRLFGHSYARGSSGLLNRTGSRLKVGWTSSGEFGGGWHLRLGRNPANQNQALRHVDFGSTHVPNDVANDLLDVIRELRGLG